jgi:hypothetical protein
VAQSYLTIFGSFIMPIETHTYADYTFKQQLEENKVEVFDSITPLRILLKEL